MARKSEIGICRLCKEHSLLSDSHIIPKMFYKKLKASANLYHVIEINKAKDYNTQKEYTEFLLCKPCEDKLNKYETYLNNSLYNFKKFYSQKNDQIIFHNIDYKKIKLFQISVLWKCFISNLPYFENCKVDLEVEEELRLRLYNSVPGKEYEFCCFMYGLFMNNKINLGFMSIPFRIEKYNELFICLTFGGFRWYYKTSSKENLDIPYDLISIKNNKTLSFKSIDMSHDPLIPHILMNREIKK